VCNAGYFRFSSVENEPENTQHEDRDQQNDADFERQDMWVERWFGIQLLVVHVGEGSAVGRFLIRATEKLMDRREEEIIVDGSRNLGYRFFAGFRFRALLDEEGQHDVAGVVR
jgi:hypothetical protein